MISLMLTWSYTAYHTGSFFIATAGMFHIVMSFPLAIFLCRKVFGIAFFDFLNFFVIYPLTRARPAMGTTALTTTGAFFANLVSKLMPVAQFGVFSGCSILINYTLV